MLYKTVSEQIKAYAESLGFDACCFCRAEEADAREQSHLSGWLSKGYHAEMGYMAANYDKRINPTALVEGAKSIVCVALNYYPRQKQAVPPPQFAYYAYGKDYHEVMKEKLNALFDYLRELLPHAGGRVFVDTAPVLERYWAAKAGIGFIGKNTMLIIPKKGSYFVLGEIITDVELDYGKPLGTSCGKCTRCLDACPTRAIEEPYLLNSNRCISYQTIENKEDISANVIPLLNNRLYGCDICQQVCPWNRFAKPHSTREFEPNSEFLTLDYDTLEQMTIDDYRRIFKGSAVKRAKYPGLMRNLNALKLNKK
jgi:epoxyqueuosine reductase